MSYIRFCEADVYIYDDVAGYTTCCTCRLAQDADAEDPQWPLKDWTAFAAHLDEHVKAGHNIPKWLIRDIAKAIKTGKRT